MRQCSKDTLGLHKSSHNARQVTWAARKQVANTCFSSSMDTSLGFTGQIRSTQHKKQVRNSITQSCDCRRIPFGPHPSWQASSCRPKGPSYQCRCVALRKLFAAAHRTTLSTCSHSTSVQCGNHMASTCCLSQDLTLLAPVEMRCDSCSRVIASTLLTIILLLHICNGRMCQDHM